MEVTLSVKIPITFQSAKDALAMLQTTQTYTKACQFVSDYIFNNNFILSARNLQKELPRKESVNVK